MTDNVNVPRGYEYRLFGINGEVVQDWTWYGETIPEGASATIEFRPLYLAAAQPEAPKVEQEPVRWEAYVTTALGSEWVIADKGHKHDYFKSLGLPMRPLYNHPAPSSDELLKQLEWEEIGQLVGRATPEIGTEYAIQEFSVWEYRYQLTIREADDAKTKTSYHHRLDDAKAAAQDDFKRRVSACIAKHKGPQS